MQPTMCSRCHKHVAVVFITKLEGGQSKNEGLCLKCAKELGIKPIDDMIQKMGITDEDLENLTSEMMSAFGGAEGMEGLMPQDREDGDEDDGRTATFPFLNQLFGAAAGGDAEPKKDAAPRPDKNGGKGQERPVKRKFLENYCISLTQRAQEGKLVMAGPGYGHGVGMSQWGAYGMAQAGSTAEEIVTYYFRDVSIETLW